MWASHDGHAETTGVIRRMIDYELSYHANTASVRGTDKIPEVGQRPILGVNGLIIANVIAVI